MHFQALYSPKGEKENGKKYVRKGAGYKRQKKKKVYGK